MIAQTLVEYGLLQSLVNSVNHAFGRAQSFIGQGNNRYLLAGGLVLLLVGLVARRRRR
jgi:LPXTG-motif cell wall-anchored protein